MEQHLLDDIADDTNKVRRRTILPVWIKIFIWIFMVTGALAVPMFVLGLTGFHFELALYGFETNEPFSLVGLLLLVLFAYKGLVSFALWFEWVWAIEMGMIDAVAGIVVCTISMFLFSGFKLELVFLVPYLIKLFSLKNKWKAGVAGPGSVSSR
jgi:hypothetical protein